MRARPLLSAALLGALLAPAHARPAPETSRPSQTPPPAAVSPSERLQALVPRIEQNLRETIIRFWFPRAIDKEHGGYTVHAGPRGEPLSGGTKMIVTQARTLWLASRLLRSDHAQPGLREAADHGYRFLRDVMWDAEHGGFVWEVDETGRKLLRPHKHLYGQAFAIYALAEYFLATGRRDGLDLAMRTFALIDERAHDGVNGGYREFFARDWSAAPPDVQPYLGGSADWKLMNTHLHLLEAFTTLLRASASPVVRERLIELVGIETSAVVRPGWVANTDRHRADWSPILDEAGARVSYGHDLENIWLVADALDALHLPVAPYRELFAAIFEYSRTHGYDEARGGFFDSGPRGKHADRLGKVWWVQAEALVSALTMYRLTADPRYLDVFEGTWRFVDREQTDWTHGEWHGTIDPDGSPRAGNKASQWKAGYHNGRALLEVLERIRAIRQEGASGPAR